MLRVLNVLFLLIMATSAVALLWLGGRLALLGGSPWYLLSGFVTLTTAALIWRRKPLSITLYWAFLGANLIWALWEAGLDYWALAARLAMPVCMGLYMLTLLLIGIPFVFQIIT